MFTCRYFLLIISFLLIGACTPENGDTEEDRTGDEPSHPWFPYPDNVESLEHVTTDDQSFYKDVVVEGLNIPWGMDFLPDGRVLITERRGDLRLVENGKLHPDPVMGVPEVHRENQGGLLDVKVHPDYENNGWIYFTYAYSGNEGNNTALARAQLEDHALTGLEILFEASPQTSGGRHFGSRIALADGYVYLTTGDRGEKNELPQDSTNTSGSVIRLNEDGSVPSDNPFLNVEGAAPEIYTYGHRNPQGMDVHPSTGEIWINEHGPRGGDEINIIKAGGNYGWPLMTHGIDYDGSVITEDTILPGKIPCIYHWTPSIAPSGMQFVTGDKYPGWTGDIMNGALARQHLNRIVLNNEEVVKEERILNGIGRIRDVNQCPKGYLYISDESNGRIIRLLPS